MTPSSKESELRSRLFKIIEPAMYNHEDTHYLDKALDKLTNLIAEVERASRIDELEKLKSQNVAMPCEPDCTELRHARHEGAWEQHLEFDNDIDNRIKALKDKDSND